MFKSEPFKSFIATWLTSMKGTWLNGCERKWREYRLIWSTRPSDNILFYLFWYSFNTRVHYLWVVTTNVCFVYCMSSNLITNFNWVCSLTFPPFKLVSRVWSQVKSPSKRPLNFYQVIMWKLLVWSPKTSSSACLMCLWFSFNWYILMLSMRISF